MRAPGEFRAAYGAAFRGYLADGGEAARRTAYELGREAVGGGLGVLDLAEAHHDALARALSDGAPADAAARAAGDFFLEALSAFEMVQRGVGEAREAAESERRHAAVLRQLSTFLTDASLALSEGDSMPEILHLVAEHARELIGGACCVATLASPGGAPALRAASFADAEAGWGARLALSDLEPLEPLTRARAPVARVDPTELGAAAPRALRGLDAGGDRPVRSWLAAPLTALDGGEIGFVHLFDERPAAFGADDGAVLLQLAQMASAAVERVQLYARGARRGA